VDRFDDAQEDPPKKGFIKRLTERFFPPAALGGAIEDSLKKSRPQTPPVGRRRPSQGAPIDMMAERRAPRTTPGRDMELLESSGRDIRKPKP
jgi:hypothetical protein